MEANVEFSKVNLPHLESKAGFQDSNLKVIHSIMESHATLDLKLSPNGSPR